jgi:glycolate oxidase iron-sulfur subunit
MRVVFAHVLPNYWLLRLAGLFLGVWQALGIDRALSVLAEQYELNKKAEPGGDALHVVSPPKNLMIIFAQWHQFLPHIAPFKKLPPRALGDASSREPVQLFSGCIMDVFYNNVNNAALDLLVAQSRLVENPEQTCCGALAFHAGEADITKNLAKRNIELFERTNGPIVVTAAGCGAMLKEYGHLLHDEPNWAQRASSFSSRVVDITETLAAGRFTRSPKARSGAGFNADSKADSTSCSMADATALKPPVVAYHAACHLAHAQGVREAPAALLSLLATVAGGKNAAVTGRGETAGKLAAGKENQPHALREPSSAVYAPIKLIALREAEHCCGSAGIYNLMHPELALKVLDRKMDNLEKTGADIVVTTNPGCLLQLETGVRRRGLKMKVQHLCQLLHEYFV